MIIQIRGTSGSGKSTVMRNVMQELGTWQPIYQTGRRQPLYYFNGRMLVMGHYEIACGGCDTIGSAKAVAELTQSLVVAEPSRIILQEGLLLSEDVIWTEKYGSNVKALFLSTDIEECLRRVNQRQAEAGREAADPARVRRKLSTRVGTIERARLRLVEAGIYCRRASSDQAADVVLKWIKRSSL